MRVEGGRVRILHEEKCTGGCKTCETQCPPNRAIRVARMVEGGVQIGGEAEV